MAALSLPSGLGAGHGMPRVLQTGADWWWSTAVCYLGARTPVFLPQQSATAICGSGGLVWRLWPKTGRGSGHPLGATRSETIRSGIKDPPPPRLSTDHQLWDCRGAWVRLPPSCLHTLRVRTEAVTRGGHKPTLALEWIHVAFYSRGVGGRRGRSLRPTEPRPVASESHSPWSPPPSPKLANRPGSVSLLAHCRRVDMRWQAGDATTLPSSRRWTVPKAGCPCWEGPSGKPPALPTPQPWFWVPGATDLIPQGEGTQPRVYPTRD